MTKVSREPNALIHSSSPYLLQHAHNPVEWHPWNADTLAKAVQQDKPLLISIGYAACHWCHVMAHESFEDEDIAQIMNQGFICVKVDREERPDIDQVYMDAVQSMTGSGGWPLTCFALPDGRPFYGGTYFHKDQWRQVLQAVIREYESNRQKLVDYAHNLMAGITNPLPVQIGSAENRFTRDKLRGMVASWKMRFDTLLGGEERAPKFPLPVNLDFLLDESLLSGDSEVMAHVRRTLDHMALGGIYDHVGGGFARYSTDRYWKVPHFEKMLYDNAQLISVYSRAHQVTSEPLYRSLVEETLTFLLRELKDPAGLFYSSLDADSEGQEGKFYIWTESQLRQALGGDYEMAASIFAINEKGLWQDDHYILLRENGLESDAAALGIPSAELDGKLKIFKRKLLKARESRVRPDLDDKALASWNGLMITALADAYRAFDQPQVLQMAEDSASFLLKNMGSPDGGLLHSWRNGRASIPGFLEDYAFVTAGLLALYQVTFNERYARQAEEIVAYAVAHFHDPHTGFFYFTCSAGSDLIARKIEVIDGVIPASNSSLALSLFQLAHLFDRPQWERLALDMLAKLEDALLHTPGAFSNWARLYLTQVYPFHELALLGENAHAFRSQIGQQHIPNLLLAGSSGSSDLPILKERFQPGRSLIYVCRDKVCAKPLEDISTALAEIGFDPLRSTK